MIIRHVKVRKQIQRCFIFSYDQYNDIVYFGLMVGLQWVLLDAINSYFAG